LLWLDATAFPNTWCGFSIMSASQTPPNNAALFPVCVAQVAIESLEHALNEEKSEEEWKELASFLGSRLQEAPSKVGSGPLDTSKTLSKQANKNFLYCVVVIRWLKRGSNR